jgi:hypothetical protein
MQAVSVFALDKVHYFDRNQTLDSQPKHRNKKHTRIPRGKGKQQTNVEITKAESREYERGLVSFTLEL